MNIFFLSRCPVESAQSQCDKHVVKMTLETSQLICTSIREGLDKDAPYRSTHKNHPSAVWARASQGNFAWLTEHLSALCKEYSHRYGKTHLCETKILNWLPPGIQLMFPLGDFEEPPQCMPDVYHNEDAVQAYRDYYRFGKRADIDMRWTRRNAPEWFKV